MRYPRALSLSTRRVGSCTCYIAASPFAYSTLAVLSSTFDFKGESHMMSCPLVPRLRPSCAYLDSGVSDRTMSFDCCGAELPLDNVHITSAFWLARLQATKVGALPAMYKQMKETGRWDCLKLEWKPGMPNQPYETTLSNEDIC
jgi:hypothetical protein